MLISNNKKHALPKGQRIGSFVNSVCNVKQASLLKPSHSLDINSIKQVFMLNFPPSAEFKRYCRAS